MPGEPGSRGTRRGSLWGQGCCQSSPRLLLHSSIDLTNFHSQERRGCRANLQLLEVKCTEGLQAMAGMDKARLETWAIMGVLTVLK